MFPGGRHYFALALVTAAASAAAAAASPPTTSFPPAPGPVTFGAGLVFTLCDTPTVVLAHNLSSSASAVYGLLTHFWSTGDTDDVLVSYFVDDEATPSVEFTPALASGQGFPDEWSEDPVSTGGLYAAGALFGKAGAVGAYYNHIRVPFYASIRVEARTAVAGKCVGAYMLSRGHEVAPGSGEESGLLLPSGFRVPLGARLELQVIPNVTFPPLSFVAVANVSFGRAGVLLASTMALSSQPAATGYIEGCWRLYRTGAEAFADSVVLGTGFEDFYSSSFWFGAASGYPGGLPFQHPASGLLHFTRGPPGGGGPAGTEQVSAYRVLDHEVVGMQDGGRLVWRVGDQAGKCARNDTANPINSPTAVAVVSYAWLYTWPNGNAVAPLPDLPQTQMSYTCVDGACVAVPDASGSSWRPDCGGPCAGPSPAPSPSPGPPALVGCSDGFCDAFCAASATVHGCAATWNSSSSGGGVSLRAPPTGRPCGNDLTPGGTVCAVPADACAPGWALCLSNASVPALSPAGFRAGLSAADCAGADPRRFIAAMQHANPAWESLPPKPCPTAPSDEDNGCAADGWGAEPICCGEGCVVPSCPNDLWMGATRIHVGENAGCGSVPGGWVDGVLCCKM
jgi:hypothetical protein